MVHQYQMYYCAINVDKLQNYLTAITEAPIPGPQFQHYLFLWQHHLSNRSSENRSPKDTTFCDSRTVFLPNSNYFKGL